MHVALYDIFIHHMAWNVFPTRGYGSNMTNTSNTNMSYNNGTVTVTNGDQSNTLHKADASQTSAIEQKLSTGVNSNVDLESGGKTPNDFGSGDIR